MQSLFRHSLTTHNLVPSSTFFFNPHPRTCLLFSEIGEGRERERERNIDGGERNIDWLPLTVPQQGCRGHSNRQTRHVRWPGIEPATSVYGDNAPPTEPQYIFWGVPFPSAKPPPSKRTPQKNGWLTNFSFMLWFNILNLPLIKSQTENTTISEIPGKERKCYAPFYPWLHWIKYTQQWKYWVHACWMYLKRIWLTLRNCTN